MGGSGGRSSDAPSVATAKGTSKSALRRQRARAEKTPEQLKAEYCKKVRRDYTRLLRLAAAVYRKCPVRYYTPYNGMWTVPPEGTVVDMNWASHPNFVARAPEEVVDDELEQIARQRAVKEAAKDTADDIKKMVALQQAAAQSSQPPPASAPRATSTPPGGRSGGRSSEAPAPGSTSDDATAAQQQA